MQLILKYIHAERKPEVSRKLNFLAIFCFQNCLLRLFIVVIKDLYECTVVNFSFEIVVQVTRDVSGVS